MSLRPKRLIVLLVLFPVPFLLGGIGEVELLLLFALAVAWLWSFFIWAKPPTSAR